MSKISISVGRNDNFLAKARKLSFLLTSLDIFNVRQHFLSTNRNPWNNTYDTFFLDIPQIFLEQRMIDHGYFWNMNAFSVCKRHVS